MIASSAHTGSGGYCITTKELLNAYFNFEIVTQVTDSSSENRPDVRQKHPLMVFENGKFELESNH